MAKAAKARPKYPSAALVLLEMLIVYAKGGVLGALVCFALQSLFQSLAAWVGNDRVFLTVGFCAVHSVLYFGLNSFFLLCTNFGWLHAYKIPHKSIAEPSAALIWKTVLQQAAMQVLVLPAVVYFLLYDFLVRNGMPAPTEGLPSPFTVFLCFVGAIAFNDVGFYSAHRILHEFPSLYVAIHKQHHEYIATIGFAAEYAHPIEAIAANLLPTLGLAIALAYHPLVFLVWLAWRLEETYESHSGYCFSGTPIAFLGLTNGFKSEFHNHHHSKNLGNYGGAYLDMLFGTADCWLSEGRPALHVLAAYA